MKALVRTMKMSEHTDTSWDAIFDVADEDRRNYCVYRDDTGRVLDSELTFSEATEFAQDFNSCEE